MTTDLPAPTSERPQPGQLTFSAPRRGKPPRHLADLSPAERKEAVEALGHKGFRAKQLSTHYFERLVESPEEMTDLPKAIRDDLVADLLPTLLTPLVQRTADDGMTIKSAWKLHDGAIVESVLMRYPKRVTICISSQAGCGMNCPFCATGQAGLTRNMSAAEIVEQVVSGARLLRSGDLAIGGAARGAATGPAAQDDHVAELGEEDDTEGGSEGDTGPTGPTRISNVVFMGMGEALANYKAAIGAIRRLTDPAPDGLGMSARGITMSTVGLVPAIDKLAAEGIPVTLALSLHAPDDELRNELVPINTRWSVDEALDAAHRYYEVTGRRVSIEYALIRDINDHAWRADLLGKKLNARGRGWVHVNPIPLNPTPGSKWTASRPGVEQQFVERLRAHGIPTTIRDTRGQDIDGACGQLAASTA
ncbi:MULTISPECIES: 23S rRNA (adenine(2503)-C(2))-methyltransferase RlmN [unclassified Phycicoccus]|uniref:23S rRNA (adenine(2503)-C(2))-methyltransferase RlmN n=1 Tax=unclassified Phycicoccus TaxID=2637926 RepID=UPI000702BD00|nr:MULTISPECIES: 23S rRNA (adenine(2503)-C(2))-methyltransferase RlmN [unclassified Phycicoccus]KRF25487.1 23S rRNA (adenine(2503)-C2)-methyltransferase [Phycicoccus sp. Soil803]KRF27902.1 23S rRNA (adenine(2503)-C2)-methyltransferase [Phycicoccus sp. Soil802]